eukprot:4298927-Pyramimonas_sp.AAC.1
MESSTNSFRALLDSVREINHTKSIFNYTSPAYLFLRVLVDSVLKQVELPMVSANSFQATEDRTYSSWWPTCTWLTKSGHTAWLEISGHRAQPPFVVLTGTCKVDEQTRLL